MPENKDFSEKPAKLNLALTHNRFFTINSMTFELAGSGKVMGYQSVFRKDYIKIPTNMSA